jgi:hypothetical protein
MRQKMSIYVQCVYKSTNPSIVADKKMRRKMSIYVQCVYKSTKSANRK